MCIRDRAIGGPLGLDVAYIASVGQMGSIWTGGGCLVPWAFGLAATAGIAGVGQKSEAAI